MIWDAAGAVGWGRGAAGEGGGCATPRSVATSFCSKPSMTAFGTMPLTARNNLPAPSASDASPPRRPQAFVADKNLAHGFLVQLRFDIMSFGNPGVDGGGIELAGFDEADDQ